MGLLIRLITGHGIPAFFFFSFVLMLLWNSIVAGHLGIGPTLSYLQTAGLWFLVTIAFAWAGLASRSAFTWKKAREKVARPIRDEISRRLENGFSKRFDSEATDELGAKIEQKIRRGFARWVDADEDTNWDELGEMIERKIKRKFSEWVD